MPVGSVTGTVGQGETGRLSDGGAERRRDWLKNLHQPEALAWLLFPRPTEFIRSIRIPEVDHPVRIVILWKHRNSSQASKILVSNRTYGEVSRILRVYRRRQRGTECFHRDGKQHLGMGDGQLRNGRGQTRPTCI